MNRVNLVYHHPVYQEKFCALQETEKDRKFCKHTLEHFMDVARLMYIYSLEHDIDLSREVIYAMALMHDIGRIDQITKGIPHEQAGAVLCDMILPDCGFTRDELSMIKAAIIHHRNAADDEKNPCYEMLYWADKKSRNCYACHMQKECHWDRNKMNLTIEY